MAREPAMKIVTESEQIVIQKTDNRKHRNLQELFQNFSDEYTCEEPVCAEWDTGAPVGKEIF